MAFTTLFTESAEDDAFTSLKNLSKSDLGILKQVTYLYKLYHGDDPRFTAKEAKTAMSAILSRLVIEDDRSAFYMGQMEWTPNIPVWMRFFDMVKPEELGSYLGITSQDEIPSFNGDGGEKDLGDVFDPDQGAKTVP